MTDVLTILAKLPEVAYTVLNYDPCQVIAIKRGVIGYYPVRRESNESSARDIAAFLNRDATPEQIEAMEIGSMFGWEVPGADPDNLRMEAAR